VTLGKPSEKEEAYFRMEELKKLRKLREEECRRMEEKECQRLKELHWMRCPKCGMELNEVELYGVMVDACFSCGGSFFDKGEVEKILEAVDTSILRKIRGVLFGPGPTAD